MKKIISIVIVSLLSLCMVLTLTNNKVKAKSDSVAYVTDSENVVLASHTTFKTSLFIESKANIVSFQLKLRYQKGVVFLVSAEKSEELDGSMVINTKEDGFITINYSSLTSITDTTPLVNFEFAVDDVDQDYGIEIFSLDNSYENVICEMSEDYQVTNVGSIVENFNTAQLGLYGDVNLDGNVTILDVTMIQLHLGELAPLTGLAKALADYNRDGNVSIQDATMIQLVLAGLVQGNKVKISFMDGNDLIQMISVDKGTYLKNVDIPVVPAKANKFGYWDIEGIEQIDKDIVINVVYEDLIANINFNHALGNAAKEDITKVINEFQKIYPNITITQNSI